MRPVVFVVAILASVAFAFSPAAASAKPPGSPQPQDVQRLFEQRGAARIYPERTVEVEQVAAIAASTEGLSASAALARVTGSGAPLAAAVATAVQCRVVDYSLHRGIFPYHRWVDGQTYWCFNYGGEITYRSSNTSARVDGVCSGSNARDWRVAGGAGYSWAIVHHEADFSCATPWWYSLNDALWMEATFDSYGNAWVSRTA